MKKYIPQLQKAALFRGVGEGELESMLGCLGASAARYGKNESILRAGDSPEAMGLVVSGRVLIVREDFWGRRDLRSQILPGETFAETFAAVPGAVMDVWAVAGEETQVVWLNVRRLLQTCPAACAHHSRMIRNLLSDLAEKNLRINEKLTHICKRTTREKLLSYLSAEARRQGRDAFDIPFDRQQLADYLAVERSAMSAELSKMQRDGLLAVHKYTFHLLERPREPGE